MAKVDPELRALNSREREFVHLMVYKGLTKEEAYAEVNCLAYNEDNMKKLKNGARAMFFKPHVYNYYNAMMEEVRDKEMNKAVWTKEVATSKLLRLIERAEKDLYGSVEEGIDPKQITMSRINAIVLPAKELNLMHGLNTTNVNLNGGCVVQFVGEDEIQD